MSNLNVYLSIFLFVSSFITFIIAVYSSKQKYVPAARLFSGLCLASTIYSFGYGMELLNNDLTIALGWNLFKYLGIEAIPLFWLLIAVQYCGMERFLTRLVKVFLIVPPLIILIIRFTNPMHHLFYTNAHMVSNGYFDIIQSGIGPFYLLSAFINISSIMVANFLYLKLLFQSKGEIKYQSAILFTASIMPMFAYFLLIFNVSPFDIDYTPFFSTISYLMILVGLFKYKFLHLVPLAHEKVFENIKDAVIVLDHQFHILDFNIAASNIFSELNKHAAGKNLNKVLGHYTELINQIYDGKETQYEKNNSQQKQFYSVKISIIYGKWQNIIGYIVSLNDITKQIENIKVLQKIATIDNLTNILNRRAFLETCEWDLSKAKKAKSPVSLIMLDLDRFKKINDQYGHQAGDSLLREVANVCKSSIRSKDILGRFGGEEFMIFLPDTSIAEAVIIGERIRRNIEKLAVIYERNCLKITASFGISEIDGEGQDHQSFDSLIKFADDALYQAKKNGRNCVKIMPIYKET